MQGMPRLADAALPREQGQGHQAPAATARPRFAVQLPLPPRSLQAPAPPRRGLGLPPKQWAPRLRARRKRAPGRERPRGCGARGLVRTGRFAAWDGREEESVRGGERERGSRQGRGTHVRWAIVASVGVGPTSMRRAVPRVKRWSWVSIQRTGDANWNASSSTRMVCAVVRGSRTAAAHASVESQRSRMAGLSVSSDT